ncbi:ABC transporter ATP-binding protein [Verminephrobacter aporrectodeae]|uniref:ABC transporter ATP-binding protein n=1 Tax=Verminephrobacter aporrectodeae TaxID=1110389 RepID=UPI0022445E46|nr:sn-glycerol-3-phosphate ABC transporter ATP-binding protein UgpC [Verminephrobacter aporrectodeae]MCW8176879.1 sn-glycerol-3-phosphate ABC transporter ATP-binding protein UgpC [Verminephrobacter aporrectodeae subsp. tuberculatae]MCW8203406.1 sn-glycerol-3-phosphate ABC transporter ATP-binding protein UgpC [Verminephrobacter aporrectodeae subsp. tuberculatae]MCW8208472.1 sn-glycerol-3-phosphate ABC transporter ATP-binding protein UgpC [Verminephrobacter aporrectodeae subsp. tuberculatae]
MASVELQNIHKAYGSVDIIKSCNLQVHEGEFIVLVGPSGCGKSTLLRCIAGLEPVSGGRLLVDGEDLTHAAPVERGVAMVFQSYALYPHMTVAQNIGFGLKIAGERKEAIAARVREVAALLHLDALLERKPKALSGGQRQRVAIGRALARKPRIFLFDEPLSNLDAALRAEMRVELAKLHQELGNTMIYVTHDQVEAMTLATRMVVMQAGVVEQVGTPLELFNRPATRFVAGFLGQPTMNFIRVQTSDCTAGRSRLLFAGDSCLDLDARVNPDAAQALEVGVRPEDCRLSCDAQALDLRIEVVEQLGSDTMVHGHLVDGQRMTLRLPGQARFKLGQQVGVSLVAERVILFDAQGRNLAPLEKPA